MLNSSPLILRHLLVQSNLGTASCAFWAFPDRTGLEVLQPLLILVASSGSLVSEESLSSADLCGEEQESGCTKLTSASANQLS